MIKDRIKDRIKERLFPSAPEQRSVVFLHEPQPEAPPAAPLALALPQERLFPTAASPLVLAYAPADNFPAPDAFSSIRRSPLDASALLKDDSAAFASAFANYRGGEFAAGDAAALSLRSTLAATAAQWAGLRTQPRKAGFARIARFLAEHPDWPASEWLRKRAEEALLYDHVADAQIRGFFGAARPQTAQGKIALARALARAGEFEDAVALARDAFREDDLSEALDASIRKDFGDHLTRADYKYRADRLIYAEKNAAGMRAAELAGKDVVLLERARVAANNDVANDAVFAAVPKELQSDPGLLLARVHRLRKAEKIAEAGALMKTAPRAQEKVVDGDAWWSERRLLARKLLDIGDFATAYEICAQHAAKSVSNKVEAEFHAGWIALRFLADPAKASTHFELLAGVAETPSQKSRADYWLARTHEALTEQDGAAKARAHYVAAAVHSTTFYGQMSREKLGLQDSPLRPEPQAAEGDARAESVRAVELYFALGEKELATSLTMEAARRIDDQKQLAALARVVAQQQDAKISLNFGKVAANRQGAALDDVAFPTYGVPPFSTLPGSAPKSVVYAIARQESAFDPRAVSSAGALGLMQMIPSTARRTASLARVPFDLARMLNEPAFNAQLGAAHLGILLGEHRGSYLLTFAAYNAGGGRVREWINAYGDPRRKDIDPIDWVERIPISETRNYVQRVMENYVVYRAKFGDATPAPQVELAQKGL